MKQALLLAAALSLASCAPRYNPYAPRPDAELSCQEVRDEIARAQSARRPARPSTIGVMMSAAKSGPAAMKPPIGKALQVSTKASRKKLTSGLRRMTLLPTSHCRRP